jgi:hypothetical protein
MATRRQRWLAWALAMMVMIAGGLLTVTTPVELQAARLEDCTNSKCNGPGSCNYGLGNHCSFLAEFRCLTEYCPGWP